MADPAPYLKSLGTFRPILEAADAEYRDADTDARVAVIEQLMDELREAAIAKQCVLADDHILQKQIINWYINNRATPKKESDPPTRAGKHWTARLVLYELYHNEIMAAIAGITDATERIGAWSKAVTEKHKSLSEEEKKELVVIADRWNQEGPSVAVKRREAGKATGKYVHSVLEQLHRALGVHALVLVAYQDESGAVKISDFESQGIPAASRFESTHADELKKIRKQWGHWAKDTFTEEDGDADPDEEAEAPKKNNKIKTPAEKYLLKGPNDLWKLGPLPPQSVLRVEVAAALHTYVTQQWRLKGGRKRVSWTKIKESNEWYISEDFLLPGRVFFDPGRMLETDLDRYWTHWYKKAKEGPGFTFKTAEPPRMRVNDRGGEGQPDDQGNPKEQSKAKVGGGKGKERATGDHGDSSEEESTSVESDKAQSPGVLTPDQCASDGDKLSFLRALCVEEVDYQFLINLVAQFRFGSSFGEIKWPARCFSWDQKSLYSDKSLHVQGTGNKLEALIQWLDTDPHLHGGEIVDRASLLQICLGLGILLGDAHLIHFTEGELSDEVPGYIAASPWNATQYGKFQNYICKVRHDLEKDIADSSRTKRKASTGEPSRPKPKVRKIAAQPLPAEVGESDDNTKVRKSSRNRREPEKYGEFETGGVGKAKQKAGQASGQGGVKKKRGGKN